MKFKCFKADTDNDCVWLICGVSPCTGNVWGFWWNGKQPTADQMAYCWDSGWEGWFQLHANDGE